MSNTMHKIKINNHVQIMLLKPLMKVPPLNIYIYIWNFTEIFRNCSEIYQNNAVNKIFFFSGIQLG